MTPTPLDLGDDWRLFNPLWLHAGWLAVVLPIGILLAASARRRVLERFATPERLAELAGRPRRITPMIRAALAVIATLGITLTLARPQSDPVELQTDQTGRDVIFLLDVSRSMLATDVAPNRLDRSKLWINDLVAELRGDRFALVTFAGSSSVRSPLTTDRAFFRMMLDEAGPDSVTRGGTNIGDAIRKTLELVIPDEPGSAPHQDIILITDGEDQESLPVEAARAAGQRGVRIIALGIGSPDGTRILTEGGDQPAVQTRLDAPALAEIAAATPGGVFFEVGTGTVDLAQLYRDLIASADQATLGQSVNLQYQERFPWFLWPAVLALLAERILVPAGTRRPR